ncbi:hypothetical protein WAF17_17940 [Bernardetia sp. ABR2-2B]|uniref:hypothetical protein n=1 Tax=Bernardetia sp. ABR2-2B TaxID=3127472 RepID=UPI0030CC7F15
MKNKTILSVSLWVLIAFLGIYYFVSQNSKKENEILTVEKSSQVLKKSIQQAHKDRYLTLSYHVGHSISNSKREQYMFQNIENAHKLAEIRYEKGAISLDEMGKYPLTKNEFSNKIISQNNSNYCLSKENKFVEKIHKLYLYKDLMNFVDDETYPNISYWGVGYRRFDIEIIENDKIAIRLTDIFHPEPIEYYLK